MNASDILQASADSLSPFAWFHCGGEGYDQAPRGPFRVLVLVEFLSFELHLLLSLHKKLLRQTTLSVVTLCVSISLVFQFELLQKKLELSTLETILITDT